MDKVIVKYTYVLGAFAYLFSSQWILPSLVNNPTKVHQIICVLLLIGSVPIAIYTIPKNEYKKVIVTCIIVGILGLLGYLFATQYFQRGQIM